MWSLGDQKRGYEREYYKTLEENNSEEKKRREDKDLQCSGKTLLLMNHQYEGLCLFDSYNREFGNGFDTKDQIDH